MLLTCPEGEACLTPGSGVVAATSEDGGEGDRTSQMPQDVPATEHGGRKLPLEPSKGFCPKTST